MARPTFQQIKKEVSVQFGLSVADIDSHCRKANLVRARQMAWLVGQRFTLLSSTIMGRMTGGRDHSTVVYGYQQARAHMNEEPVLLDRYLATLKQLDLVDVLNDRSDRNQ